jgi:hypothetical protein
MRRSVFGMRGAVLLAAALVLGAVGAAAAIVGGTVDPPPRMAFVARADNAADALGVGPIAGRFGAPLFTTWRDELVEDARVGLAAHDPELVIIAGGQAAIGPAVEQAIRDLLPAATVRRVAGVDRNQTTRLVAELINDYDPAFLPVDATSANADLLDGKDASAFALAGSACADGEVATGIGSDGLVVCTAVGGPVDHDHFARIVVVPAGAGATENGQALLDAIAASAGATIADPWMVFVEPGVFDVGSTRVVVPAYVELAGAGSAVTAIRGTGSQTSNFDAVVQPGGSEVTFRDFTVEATGGRWAVPLGWVSSHTGILIDGVVARSSGATGTNGDETNHGIRARGTAVIRDSRIEVTGDGTTSVVGLTGAELRVENTEVVTAGDAAGNYGHRAIWASSGADLTLIDVVVTTAGADAVGLYTSHGGFATVLGGIIESSDTGVHMTSATDTVVQGAMVTGVDAAAIDGSGLGALQLAGTRLVGGVVGDALCAGVYDAGNSFYTNTCPVS